MKILIITAFFPPLNSIASLRPYSWAKYWARSGHDVTVLTVPQQSSLADSPMSWDGMKVIEVAIPGLKTISKILGRGRAPVTPENLSGAKIENQISWKSKIRQRRQDFQAKYGILSSCRMPDLLDIWGRAAFKKVKSEDWDLVISTAGPYGVHAPANALRRSGKAKKWIADWRDLWVDNHIFPGLPGFRSIERILERRWSLQADVITTVSTPLAEVLRAKYGQKVSVIYNGFDAEDYANLPAEKIFPRDGVLRIVYTGTLYPTKHDPQPLFQAIAELVAEGEIRTDQFKVVFCGRNTDVSELAARAGVSDYVQCLGLVPREDALRMQRDAAMLLFLEFQSQTTQGILSGKIFEYLFAGPPILGLGGNPNSSVGKLLKDTRKGELLGSDVQKIKIQLLNAKNNFQSSGSLPMASNESLDFFSRKVQAEKILQLLKW